jgi:HD-like signal output (HDOD) protein
MSTLDSFFSAVKLPSMSEVAHELIQTLNDEDVAIPKVRGIIAKDPALTAKLLRMANSAQFGLQRGVSTLDDAISLVGMAKVRTISLCSCMNDSFPVLPGLERNEFWRTSMHCAGYAQWLAGGLGMDGQTAWLTGMMVRLGELLIGQADPKALLEIEALPHLPGARWEREKRLVGFSEGQVTAELARRWNFPEHIVQALQSSSDPLASQVFSKLGAIVHLAGLLADAEEASEKMIDTLPQDVVGALLLDVQWMHKRFPAADSFIDITAQS